MTGTSCGNDKALRKRLKLDVSNSLRFHLAIPGCEEKTKMMEMELFPVLELGWLNGWILLAMATGYGLECWP